MSRFDRANAILAAIETIYGTDAGPTGLANALLVSNQSINPINAQNVERDLVRAYFGNSEQLLGPVNRDIGFSIEAAGSGTPATPPAWGPVLRACAFAETIGASYVEYTPITDNQESLTIYYNDSGVLHKALGCRGNIESLSMEAGQIPRFAFKFLGLDGGDTASALPSTTLSAFKTPLVVTNANSGDITLGGTYATGAVTGGSAVPSQGLSLALGNAVTFTPLLGGETVDITDRKASGSVTMDLDAAQEVANLAAVKGATTQSLSFEHGTVAGNKILIFLPAVQLTNPQKVNVNGRRLIKYDLRVMPSAGNDEIRIVTK